jgi:predicted transposase/invertase (TIGR01784 family)
MKKLEYTFKNDILFKIVFTQRQDSLKRLVASILKIKYDKIENFVIINPELPPDFIGDKFCRLDINMIVDGQLIDLEIQMYKETYFPERSLYYWAREFSRTLKERVYYNKLPNTIIISILGFNIFECKEYHSIFKALEISRHTLLSDKFCLHYLELLKIPELSDIKDDLLLLLTLFKAESQEDLDKILCLEVDFMSELIGTYNHIITTDEFQELERLRFRARNDEASALEYARDKGRVEGMEDGQRIERVKWLNVVSEKDKYIEMLEAKIRKTETNE